MAKTHWRLEGRWIKNCTCSYGCPCDFNARPTHGECKGIFGMCIDQGHFGSTRLDGLYFFAAASWPGALHEGNGQLLPILDRRASSEQRDALLQILSGQHCDEGTLFHILGMIVTKVHDPVFAAVEMEFNQDARTARVSIPGILDTTVEPIKNPVTGAPHKIRVMLPEGFEYLEAEVASASISCHGAIPMETRGSHASLAHVVQTPQGVAA